jgi:hypothetical protein
VLHIVQHAIRLGLEQRVRVWYTYHAPWRMQSTQEQRIGDIVDTYYELSRKHLTQSKISNGIAGCLLRKWEPCRSLYQTIHRGAPAKSSAPDIQPRRALYSRSPYATSRSSFANQNKSAHPFRRCKCTILTSNPRLPYAPASARCFSSCAMTSTSATLLCVPK